MSEREGEIVCGLPICPRGWRDGEREGKGNSAKGWVKVWPKEGKGKSEKMHQNCPHFARAIPSG